MRKLRRYSTTWARASHDRTGEATALNLLGPDNRLPELRDGKAAEAGFDEEQTLGDHHREYTAGQPEHDEEREFGQARVLLMRHGEQRTRSEDGEEDPARHR